MHHWRRLCITGDEESELDMLNEHYYACGDGGEPPDFVFSDEVEGQEGGRASVRRMLVMSNLHRRLLKTDVILKKEAAALHV